MSAARKARPFRPRGRSPAGSRRGRDLFTSIGSGNRPSVSTSFDSSAITIMRAEAAATIFSRKSAPPPPLISESSKSTSSAPSMVRSSSGVSSSVDSGTPSSRQSAAVRSDVGTPTILMPAATFSASRRTNSSAVEPVPMPSRIPSVTWPRASRAASIFNALASMPVSPPRFASGAPIIFALQGKAFVPGPAAGCAAAARKLGLHPYT